MKEFDYEGKKEAEEDGQEGEEGADHEAAASREAQA
jgi:hypothetical protein